MKLTERRRLFATFALGVLASVAGAFVYDNLSSGEGGPWPDLELSVRFIDPDTGAKSRAFAFAWERPLPGLTVFKPLALDVDQEDYAGGAPGLEVTIRGRVEGENVTSQPTVTAVLDWVNPRGVTGHAEQSQVLTDWTPSTGTGTPKDRNEAANFKFHWDPLVAGTANVCAEQKGSATTNMTAVVTAEALGIDGSTVRGEARTAGDFTYRCSTKEFNAGLSFVIDPLVITREVDGELRSWVANPKLLS